MKNLIFSLFILVSITSAQEGPQWALTGSVFQMGNLSIEAEGYIKASNYSYITLGGGYGINIPYMIYYMGDNAFLNIIPHHATINFGFKQTWNFLELGYMGILAFDRTDAAYSAGILLGYRHHGRRTKFLWKAYTGPSLVFSEGFYSFGIMAGLSFGVRR